MAWIAAAAVLGGAIISSQSASDASDTQAGATAGAVGEQRRQFNVSRADLAPWRDTGAAAIYRIGDLMGLGGGTGGSGGTPTLSQIRQSLSGQFGTNRVEIGEPFQDPGQINYFGDISTGNVTRYRFPDGSIGDRQVRTVPGVNTGALESEAQRLFTQQGIALGGASGPGGAPGGLASGDLARKFTMQDFMSDPVTQASFQFGLDEGRKAIERRAPLVGGFDSGSTLKALTRYGTDYGGQKAGESFNRFQTEGSNIYNRLANTAGLGQTSAAQTANLGALQAGNISELMANQGNAAAGSRIAQGNIWGSAAGTIGNWWSEQNRLDQQRRLMQPDYSAGYY